MYLDCDQSKATAALFNGSRNDATIGLIILPSSMAARDCHHL
jgi:hypothetical protein